ncbi:NAD(P)/FAD-dependent oxidoreductase [Pseudoruegeria sp. HB172150]|uniref:NAD(P)/FAD-dependent oxidoreductase n=1 Tax=Pseudoruegeria sp. HB172150 TaxID=2721164 RepID=UPI001551BAAA|nr:FAD-dependent oxidoreductase [Pseudoruegeria sp. HB172150]
MSAEHDVAIIGGGIAGLSAALSIGRLGYSAILLADGVPGGELVKINQIDGIPGHEDGIAGYDLCPITQEQAEQFGVIFTDHPAKGIAPSDDCWLVTSDESAIAARSVVIASGTSLAKLDVPGVERLEGKGVSDCASCDAPLLRGKVAVVAGGGDSAMQEALVLAEQLEKVIMVVRGEALSGQAAYKNSILDHPKIECRFSSEPVEVIGDNVVTRVKIKNLVSGNEDDIAADAIFTFIGLVPNTEFAGDSVKLDETGRINVDLFMRSSARGICAVGNVRQASPHRAAAAMGDATAAASALDMYLTSGKWRET